VDSTRSDVLVNREMFYTAVSRAEFDTQVYTDNVPGLRNAVAWGHVKEIALDAVKQPQRTQPLQPQHAHSQEESQRPELSLGI
jgi:hypothetical protein